jgi:hypothetical protein
MKTHKPIFLALAMVFLLACNLPSMISGSSGSTPQSQEGQTNDKGVGPKTLDVTDPALAKQFTSSVSSHLLNTYESVDKAGAPNKVTFEVTQMEQIEPQWSSYNHVRASWNSTVDPEKEMEGGALNGKNFSIGSGKCWMTPDKGTHTPLGTFLDNLQNLQSKINRVEDGVEINGVLTDRYALKLSNIRFSDNVKEFKLGNLYRAQEGGYLVRFEYTAEMNYDSSQAFDKEFDPSKPVLFTEQYDLTYYKPGDLVVKLPDLCAGK